MNIFLKSAAGILIAVIIGHSLSKQNKDTALLLVMGVCVMVLISAMEYFQPVVDFFQKLQSMGNLDSQMLSVLLKTVGIGVLSEITALICADSGNAALGKGLQILASAVILWMSVPLMTELMSLIEGILGGV